MFKNWKFPVFAIIIVGAAAFITPRLGLAEAERTIPMFVLFTCFIIALQLLFYFQNRYRK